MSHHILVIGHVPGADGHDVEPRAAERAAESAAWDAILVGADAPVSVQALALHAPVVVVGGPEALEAGAVEFSEPAHAWRRALRVAEVRRADRERDQLLGRLAHDLRSPLSALVGNSDYLLRDLDLDGEALEVARDVALSSSQLRRMVLDMSDLTRVLAGGMDLQRRRLDVPALLAQVRDSATDRATESGHTVVVDTPPDLPVVRGDSARLARALADLVDNALRYAPPGPVRLGARVESGHVVLTVTDDGPRVPADFRELLFTLWSGEERPPRASRGLALAYCGALAQAHGGSARAADADPSGCRLELHLPCDGGSP